MSIGSEFKAFIARGNVLDLAVGVIIGGAFGKIVDSVVSDLIMPVVGAVFGGADFSNFFMPLGTQPGPGVAPVVYVTRQVHRTETSGTSPSSSVGRHLIPTTR